MIDSTHKTVEQTGVMIAIDGFPFPQAKTKCE